MSMTEYIAPYEPKDHAAPWKEVVLDRRNLTPGRLTGGLFAGLFIGGIFMIAGNLVAMILLGILGHLPDVLGSNALVESIWRTSPSDPTLWVPETSIYALLTIFFGCMIVAGEHADTDRNLIRKLRDRVQAYARHWYEKGSDIHQFLEIAFRDHNVVTSAASRQLLFRLDAVVISHIDTTRELGAKKEAIDEATTIAREAFWRIYVAERDAQKGTGADALARMRARTDAIVAGDVTGTPSIAASAPTARIAHLVATAERALAISPDLVDDNGASVADLVRVHVPRLLQRHAQARHTATGARVNAIDDELDEGVENIRLSVEAAVRTLGDDAADALATELRFLELRRRPAASLSAAKVVAIGRARPEPDVRPRSELTPLNYVADFIAAGETSNVALRPWERAYQDAGVIEEARRLGYLEIGRDPRCSITITEKGRALAEDAAA